MIKGFGERRDYRKFILDEYVPPQNLLLSSMILKYFVGNDKRPLARN